MDKGWEIANGETSDDYGYRLYKNKSLYGLRNDDIYVLINDVLGKNCSESTHRGYFTPYIKGFDTGYERGLMAVNKSISNVKRNSTEVYGLNSLAPKSHLDRLSELVGEYGIRKRDMQLERNELAKLYRQVTPWILMAEQYREAIVNDEIEIPDFNFSRIDTSGEAIIKVLPSDWHIGALIDEEYNVFNYEVAVKRIDKYCERILEEAKRENAKLISITGLGDFIENLEMRPEQKWFCEFLLNDQIMYAQKLFMYMIMTLSENYNVEVCAVYGNHDRLVGQKNLSIGEDNAVRVIMENIKFTIEFASSQAGVTMERITFVESSENYKYQVEDIYGHKCRWQHGHEDSKNDERKIEKYNGVDDASYNILGFGHLHHGRVVHGNRGNFEVYVGSVQGSNEYGKYKVKSVSNASQCIIIFRENGDVIPYEVDLQDVE